MRRERRDNGFVSIALKLCQMVEHVGGIKPRWIVCISLPHHAFKPDLFLVLYIERRMITKISNSCFAEYTTMYSADISVTTSLHDDQTQPSEKNESPKGGPVRFFTS